MKVKIGADPELFLKKDGVFISAFGMVPGSKKEPFPVKCGAVQVDGMALEFNINPAETQDEFTNNIETVLTALRNMVPHEFDFSFEAVARFAPDYLLSQPIEARMLGCDPDFNAYTGRMNSSPKPKKPIRTAAGHVHVGWINHESERSEDHVADCRDIVKQLDFMLGIPSVLIDGDNERRKLYGKAGAFRPKPYGVEYRVLSNFWLTKKSFVKWVFSTTQQAIENLRNGVDYYKQYSTLARDIINSTNKEEALSFIKKHNLVCPV